MSGVKQHLQLAGLAQAWLDKPGRYRFGLHAALGQLEDDENADGLFVSVLNGTVFEGLTVTTDRRVLCARFRFWLWPWPVIRSFRYGEISNVTVESADELPAIRLHLTGGSSVRLKSTTAHAARFDNIAEEIRRRASGDVR
jgi:hypothetical protein